MDLQSRLYNHLISTDGHIGRTGSEMTRLAEKSGASVHMIQSVVLGRRVFRDENAKRVKTALAAAERRVARRL